MSEVTPVAPDSAAVAPAVELSDDMTEHEVASHLADKWFKKRQAAEAPVKAAEPPKQVQAPEADSAPPQEVSAETTETVEPEAELPLIDPPRSWTKEEKEEFASYPREAQEKIARREQDRETALRRSQNEAAEERKAAQAARDAAEKARQEYDRALPSLIQTLKTAQAGEFSDIKTQEDVNKLATEDWPRFARWQAHMMQIGTLEQEAKAAQERQTSEFKTQWNDFASKEDQKFLDSHPEYADADKRGKIAEAVIRTAEAAGLTKDELIKSYNGELALSPRSAALQEIFLKAALYDQAKTNIAKPAPKPVPPVQRPGTTKPVADNSLDAEISTLTRRVAQTGSLKDATALRLAKMKRAAQG